MRSVAKKERGKLKTIDQHNTAKYNLFQKRTDPNSEQYNLLVYSYAAIQQNLRSVLYS